MPQPNPEKNHNMNHVQENRDLIGAPPQISQVGQIEAPGGKELPRAGGTLTGLRFKSCSDGRFGGLGGGGSCVGRVGGLGGGVSCVGRFGGRG